MILYTIQTEKKWNEFQETGILKADNDIICFDHFLQSYEWLEGRMRDLLPSSDIECKHPIWAWYKYCGKNKPDLRKRGHLSKNEIGYRIEFEIDEKNVLLTDFSDWHLILSSDETAFEIKHTYFELNECDEEEIISYIGEGWFIKDDKILFDWNNIILDKNSNLRDIQATMWYIKMEQVKNITKFKSR
jgi:hypothetical protein